MDNIIHSAKSSTQWTIDELRAYKIDVTTKPAVEFFGHEVKRTLDYLDPRLVLGTLNAEGLSDHTLRTLQYLDMATRSNGEDESVIGDAAKEILRVVGFEARGTLLRSRRWIPFVICGDGNRSAYADICIVSRSSTILLVLIEAKTTVKKRDLKAQLIAVAIATFQHNNHIRIRANAPKLDQMTIPCIMMTGTCPTFYKVPVTRELGDAVKEGKTPVHPTKVTKCIVATAMGRSSGGMGAPVYRKVALQHYDAFKVLAKTCWDQYFF